MRVRSVQLQKLAILVRDMIERMIAVVCGMKRWMRIKMHPCKTLRKMSKKEKERKESSGYDALPEFI